MHKQSLFLLNVAIVNFKVVGEGQKSKYLNKQEKENYKTHIGSLCLMKTIAAQVNTRYEERKQNDHGK